jgi:hypothetical protein
LNTFFFVLLPKKAAMWINDFNFKIIVDLEHKNRFLVKIVFFNAPQFFLQGKNFLKRVFLKAIPINLTYTFHL